MTDDRERPDLDARWEELGRFLAGESPPDEAQRIRAQLAEHPERASLVRALDAALPRPSEPPLSPREVDAALGAVMARRDLPVEQDRAAAPSVARLPSRPSVGLRQTRSRWRREGLRAAAAVVLVAAAGFVWRAARSSDRAAPAGQSSLERRIYRTAAGQLDTVRLADGSTVVMGPGSRVGIGDAFGARSREVELAGQAYFDVVHDDARPFVVRTASAMLRDVGTTFSVHADSVGGTRVAVSSGAIDVVATRAATSEPIVLHAGDLAVVTDAGVRVERGVVTDSEPAWTRGILEFRDAPLATVASELRRWYGVELVVTDPTIASRRLTATFDRAAAGDVGRVLAAVLGGSVTRTGDTLRLGAAGAR